MWWGLNLSRYGLVSRVSLLLRIALGVWLVGVPANVHSSKVIELSDRFLDIYKNGGRDMAWIVKFYAPWCGHCKRLEPIYLHVAQAVHDLPVRVGRVDCTRFPQLAAHFNVQAFPTIMFLRSPSHSATPFVVYGGERTAAEITWFVRRMLSPALEPLPLGAFPPATTPPDKAAKQQGAIPPGEFSPVGENPLSRSAILLSGDPASDPLFPPFSAAAHALQPLLRFYVGGKFEKSGMGEGVWVAKSEDPAGVADFERFPVDPNSQKNNREEEEVDENSPEGNLTLAMIRWLERERFPRFLRIGQGNFHQLVSTGKLLFALLLEEDKLLQHDTELREEFHKWTTQIQNSPRGKSIQFGFSGQPEIFESVAVGQLTLPCVVALNSTGMQVWVSAWGRAGKTTQLDIFLQGIVNGELPATLGGVGVVAGFRRSLWDLRTGLERIWRGNPVLTTVLLGLPAGFLSLICYSVCCGDILEDQPGSYDSDEIPEDLQPENKQKAD